MKSLAIITISVFVLSIAQTASARQSICYPEYKACITYTKSEEVELALTAIKKAYDFFFEIGYSENYFLKIVFQSEIMVEGSNGDMIRVYGKLGKNNHIYLTNWSEAWLTEQNSYGLKMSKEFYESIIVHEIAHFIAEKIACRKIEITHSEYIAYVAQFSKMAPNLRKAILSQRPLPAFETGEISLEVMLMNPASFAVKSYLHFKYNKGQYLKAILSGTIPEFREIDLWYFN